MEKRSSHIWTLSRGGGTSRRTRHCPPSSYHEGSRLAVNPPAVAPGGDDNRADGVPNGEGTGSRIVELELEKTRPQNLGVLVLPDTVSVKLALIHEQKNLYNKKTEQL
jgi:hypothetical protein